MTRPQIVRADTLDLQDKTSPTAQDHTAQPATPAPLGIGPAAPHQEASLRHVQQERSDEQENLKQAWNDAGNNLREDPGSDDDRTLVNGSNGNQQLQQDEQAVRLNGGMSGGEDDGEGDGDMADAEVEDLDDDMMDKISSSPSIDDGGYSLPSSPWPKRTSSLTPISTPTQSPANSPTSPDFISSSPFTAMPLHLPLSASGWMRRRDGAAPETDLNSRSLYTPPTPSSSQSQNQQHPVQPQDHHHHLCDSKGYVSNSGHSSPTKGKDDIENCADESERRQYLPIIEERLRNTPQTSQISLLSSNFDEDDLHELLLPANDPLLDTTFDDPRQNSEIAMQTPSDDGSSWTTDSDPDSAAYGTDDDDDSNGVFFSDDSRYIDTGWSGECLRETEDIDFEFVYALHTFVATVEGQANATKGDTMVLLDDSNSYWWLVRVVKDSSIGYLPAEHIETPTERLARLNKHRNIDLSAAMLGDTAEKSKNPLKKAMRRRNAKTVQFAAPTYVSASEYEYSSDEDNDNDELFGGADPEKSEVEVVNDRSEPEQDDGLKVEPLKVGAAKKEGQVNTTEGGDANKEFGEEPSKNSPDNQRTSDEMFDRPLDQKVSRNGTLRNTDSFFKDDNAETRKITLTPNLLRDDSSTSTTGSKERGPSLESLEKNGFADKVKEDKKKKEKKPGMLSGLFKRKDKKPKGVSQDSFDSDTEKQSAELGRGSPQSKNSDDSPVERSLSEKDSNRSPQRQPSKGKLQKAQRGGDVSPPKNRQDMPETESPEPTALQTVAPLKPRSNGQQNAGGMRMVTPEVEPIESTEAQDSTQQPAERSGSLSSAAAKLNPINILGRGDSEPRPEKVKKAKQRVQLDDFDTPDQEKDDPFADPEEAQTETSEARADAEAAERLSESPIQISPADAQPPGTELSKKQEPDPSHPPELTGDTSSQESSSPISTPSPSDDPSTTTPSAPNLAAARPVASPSPTKLDTTAAFQPPPPNRPAPIPTHEMQHSPPDSSSSGNLPAWSDASLRSYLDDGSDIRDMLVVVNDTNGVVPVGPEHPIMAGLFVDERNTMKDLGGRLDGLLGDWIEKKRKKSLGSMKAAR